MPRVTNRLASRKKMMHRLLILKIWHKSNLNSHHHMESFDIKVTVLVAKFLTIGHYLSLLEPDDLLSLLQQKKNLKNE